MALNGTITGSTGNQYIDAKIVWSATQSVDGNYSMVTATLYYSRNNTGYTTSGTWNGSLIINGTKKTSSASLSITYNSNTQAITNTVKVIHDGDGTKEITISATGSIPGTTLSSTNVSKSVELTTIPRAATLDSLTCSTTYLSGTITYKYTPTTTSYYVRGNLSLNLNGEYIAIKSDNNGKPSTATQQTKTIQLDAEQLEKIYNELPSDTSATLRLTLRTYSDSSYSKQIGDPSHKEIKLTIPTSVKPTVGDITLDPTNITINGTSYNYLIKGKNKLSISVSGCSAGIGSGIKSYTFSGPSVSATTTSASTSVTSVTNVTSFTDEKATLTYSVKATDKRGRSSDAKTETITCYNYVNPYFSAFKVSRSGATLTCTYTPVFSSINGKNIANVKIYYTVGSTTNTKTISSVTSGVSASASITLANSASTCQVYAVITDGLNETGKTAPKTLYGESKIMNVTSDGTGIAFGKKAESSNLFECKWPSKFDGLMVSTGGIRTEADGASNRYFEVRRKNPTEAPDDAHNNIRMQMYVGETGYPTIRNQYSTDDGDTWTTRGYIRLQDDGVYADGFRIPEIQHGRISITPSAANTPTAKIVTFNKEFSGTPTVTTTPLSGVPGTTVLGTSATEPSATQVNIYLTRTNTTSTSVQWIAVY